MSVGCLGIAVTGTSSPGRTAIVQMGTLVAADDPLSRPTGPASFRADEGRSDANHPRRIRSRRMGGRRLATRRSDEPAGTVDDARRPAERSAEARLAASGLQVAPDAMAVISNLYRAAGAARNHFERTVLLDSGLTWTSWVVLWVIWVAGQDESRVVAAESGISKATLTGVVKTLSGRGLVSRSTHPDDARRVLLSLTTTGASLMRQLVPRFNEHEARLCEVLEPSDQRDLAAALRRLTARAEQLDAP